MALEMYRCYDQKAHSNTTLLDRDDDTILVRLGKEYEQLEQKTQNIPDYVSA